MAASGGSGSNYRFYSSKTATALMGEPVPSPIFPKTFRYTPVISSDGSWPQMIYPGSYTEAMALIFAALS